MKSNIPSATNAVTYAGIASGSNKAQENILRPGNSHTAVNQARLTPRSADPEVTPNVNQHVLISRLRRVVSIKCCQISFVGERNDETTTTPTGISTSVATKKGIKRQLSIVW